MSPRARPGYVIQIAQYVGARPNVHVGCRTCSWDQILVPEASIEDLTAWVTEAVGAAAKAWQEHTGSAELYACCPSSPGRQEVHGG